jgi:hypothetical protein
MTAPPLTHHEIVRLVEPFARQGRHVDLGASDRTARRIVFKSRELAAEPAGQPAPGQRITRELDCRSDSRFVLLRTVTGPGGATATCSASGPELAELLARIDAVPPAQLFSAGAGWRGGAQLRHGAAERRAGAGHGRTRRRWCWTRAAVAGRAADADACSSSCPACAAWPPT